MNWHVLSAQAMQGLIQRAIDETYDLGGPEFQRESGHQSADVNNRPAKKHCVKGAEFDSGRLNGILDHVVPVLLC